MTPPSIVLDPAILRCATHPGMPCLPASLPPMHGSALPRLPSRTLLVARRPPCLPPVTYCRVRRCPHSCTTRAAHPDDVPASSARARPPYSSRPDLELDSYFYHTSNPGLVPSASQHCWRHGVQYSAGCLVDYYLLTVFDGAWELLELSKARPRTAALPSRCISPPISPMLHMRCCPPNTTLDLSGARARVGLRTAAAAPPGARPGPRRRAFSQRSCANSQRRVGRSGGGVGARRWPWGTVSRTSHVVPVDKNVPEGATPLSVQLYVRCD